MKPGPDLKKELVLAILRNARHFPWTMGSNGRISCPIVPGNVVINLFEHSLAVPGHSAVHSHGADFKSEIIGGRLYQYRMYETADPQASPFIRQEVNLQNELAGAPVLVHLREEPAEVYEPGDTYEITAPEIHRIDYEDLTVTLISSQFRTNPKTIRAYQPYSPDRANVRAETPRLAPPAADLVAELTRSALLKWWPGQAGI